MILNHGSDPNEYVRSIRLFVLFVLLGGIVSTTGCAGYRRLRQLEGSEKTAFMVYTDNDSTNDQARRARLWIDGIGREAFLADMEILAGWEVGYKHEALYCIGLLGDRRHVALVASKLDDNSQETQKVAVGALSRLTSENFSDVSSAKTWWETHKHSYPPIEQRR